MNFRAEDDLYCDIWNSESYFQARKSEVREHLIKLGLNRVNFDKILEIGPGIGVITEVLRENYPAAKITVIDRDRRAITKAKASGLVSLYKDVTDLSGKEIRGLGADLILALSTSHEVVRHLLQIATSGLVVASIIRDVDVLGFDACWRETAAMRVQRIPLIEQRGRTEVAFIKDFG